MPFQKGNQLGQKFSSENQPETNGRKEGVRNRSTIARQVLALSHAIPTSIAAEHPDIDGDTTIEEVMAIVQANRAINGDTNAYKALMDSAYGQPKQSHEHTGEDGGPVTFFELPKKQS